MLSEHDQHLYFKYFYDFVHFLYVNFESILYLGGKFWGKSEQGCVLYPENLRPISTPAC